MHLWYTATAEGDDTATAAELTTTVKQQTSTTDSDSSTVTADVTTVTDSLTQTGIYMNTHFDAHNDKNHCTCNIE